MGFLACSAGEHEIDDRLLAHVKVAAGMKLRRHESFFVNWMNPLERGSGRISVWVSPDAPLSFRFTRSHAPELNRTWIQVLHALANTPRGMTLISEEEAEAYAQEQETQHAGAAARHDST